MAANLTALTEQVTALQAVATELKAASDASQELATRTIATLIDLVNRIAALEPNQQAIDALAASVSADVAKLQTESTEQASANAAVTAQLDAIPPATP